MAHPDPKLNKIPGWVCIVALILIAVTDIGKLIAIAALLLFLAFSILVSLAIMLDFIKK